MKKRDANDVLREKRTDDLRAALDKAQRKKPNDSCLPFGKKAADHGSPHDRRQIPPLPSGCRSRAEGDRRVDMLHPIFREKAVERCRRLTQSWRSEWRVKRGTAAVPSRPSRGHQQCVKAHRIALNLAGTFVEAMLMSTSEQPRGSLRRELAARPRNDPRRLRELSARDADRPRATRPRSPHFRQESYACCVPRPNILAGRAPRRRLSGVTILWAVPDLAQPAMRARRTDKRSDRRRMSSAWNADKADRPLDGRFDQRPANAVRMGYRVFGNECEAQIGHDHGLDPILARRAEARIEADAARLAYAHDHLAHLAGQAIDVGLLGEVLQREAVRLPERMLGRKQDEVALLVERLRPIAVAKAIERVEYRRSSSSASSLAASSSSEPSETATSTPGHSCPKCARNRDRRPGPIVDRIPRRIGSCFRSRKLSATVSATSVCSRMRARFGCIRRPNSDS